jgi:glycosyltransferase involved in cell wall biosynthesis
MRFSIIVPIYNVSTFINECLESIKKQSYKDFECILVDDGSTDESGKICDSFANNDPRFRVIHKENGGLVSARKTGAGATKGEYVLSVDGDDYIEYDMLKNMSDIIDQYAPDAICFGYTPFGGNRRTPVLNSCSPKLYTDSQVKELSETYLYNPNVAGINSGTLLFNICCKCIKRPLYVQCQEQVPNDIISGEDTVFTLHFIRKVNTLYISEYAGYYYRQNNTSIEHQFSEVNITRLFTTYHTLNEASECDSTARKNAVNIYFMYRLWFYYCGMAIYSKTYKEYKAVISKIIKWYIPTIAMKHNIQSYIKYNLLKHKLYLIIYILAKTYFRKKLEL